MKEERSPSGVWSKERTRTTSELWRTLRFGQGCQTAGSALLVEVSYGTQVEGSLVVSAD